jgi:hypothetical protein
MIFFAVAIWIYLSELRFLSERSALYFIANGRAVLNEVLQSQRRQRCRLFATTW